MANEIQVKFNNLNLESGTEYSISSINIKESKSVNLHKIPKTDGAISETARRESIEISVEGQIGSSNYDTLRTSIDNLKASLHSGIQNFYIDDDRYIKAQLKSFDKEWISFRTLASFEATFVAHYPFWLDVNSSSDSRVPTSGVGYVINNAGNCSTRLKVVVTASGQITDALKIENQTNGKFFQYRGTVLAGNSFTADNRFDTDDFIITNNAVDDFANFEGDFIELEAGDNTIIYTGTASATVALTYRNCWY